MNDRRTLALLSAAAVLICLPMILFNEIPGNDTAGVYSRLMREVGAGRWNRAFFHLVPPLMPVAGGIFVALGASAFTAAKITSAIFFALTILPLYGLFRRMYDRRTALVACVLYLLCSPIVQYAGEGVLATTKTFFLVFTVYTTWRFFRTPSWSAALLGAVAAAGLTLARGEGIIFSGLAWLLMGLAVLRPSTPQSPRARRMLMLFGAGLMFVFLILPWVVYEYKETGWLVTDGKQALLIRRLLGREPRRQKQRRRQPQTERPKAAPAAVLVTPLKSPSVEIMRGMFWPFWLLILPVLVLRLRRRQWQFADTFLVGWILVHTAFFVLFGRLTGVVERRYFVAALPLTLGWAAMAVRAGWGWLQKRHAVLPPCVAALLAAVLLWRGTVDARPERKPHKRQDDQAVAEIANWLREPGAARVPPTQTPLAKTKGNYQNGRLPVVFSVYPAVVLLADADWAFPPRRNIRYTPETFRRQCDEQQVNFVILNAPLRVMAPFLADPATRPRQFVVVHDKWQNAEEPYTVLGYTPNLIPGQEANGTNPGQE